VLVIASKPVSVKTIVVVEPGEVEELQLFLQ